MYSGRPEHPAPEGGTIQLDLSTVVDLNKPGSRRSSRGNDIKVPDSPSTLVLSPRSLITDVTGCDSAGGLPACSAIDL